jgi:hypothetical protein
MLHIFSNIVYYYWLPNFLLLGNASYVFTEYLQANCAAYSSYWIELLSGCLGSTFHLAKKNSTCLGPALIHAIWDMSSGRLRVLILKSNEFTENTRSGSEKAVDFGVVMHPTLQHHIVIPSCLLRQPHLQHDCQRSMQSSRFVI